MPAMTGKANLGGLLAKHAADPLEEKTDYSEPPGGITDGVARLVYAKRGQYKADAQKNAGEWFVQLSGVIVSPETVAEVVPFWDSEAKPPGVKYLPPRVERAAGKRTTCGGGPLPLCATTRKDAEGKLITTPAEDNVRRVIQELQHLGGEGCTAHIRDEADLDALLEQLVAAKPFFRFAVRFGKPTAVYTTARKFQEWYGGKGLEQYHLNGDAQTAGVADSGGASTETGAAAAEVDAGGEPDLDALVEAANGDDETASQAAIDRLGELARAAGYADADIEADNVTWEDVAEMIRKPQTDDAATLADAAGEEQDAEASTDPDVGYVYFYKARDAKGNVLKDPRSKKPVKAVEVGVTAVNKARRTVQVQDNKTKKPLLGGNKKPLDIPWDHLEEGT